MLVHPFLRRRIVEPLFGVLRGRTLLHEFAELCSTQYLSEAELGARQAKRLRRLLRSAYENSPFYRARFEQAHVEPEDIRTAGDLVSLPVTTKQDVRTKVREILARGISLESLMESRTGGSTGIPLALRFTEEVSERRNAAARRSNRWTGWRVGEPVGAVWGNPHLPGTIKERLRHQLLDPVIYLDTMQLREETIARFAEEWQRVKPTLLFGHAHSIYALARGLEDLGIDSVRPKGVVSTSMMLLGSERLAIERVIRAPVFDRYGCEEVGLIAAECERHDGMHINIDHLIVEFLGDDGAPAPPGVLARVVVTDLLNEAMPLIRYDVGDLAAQRPGICPCGRGLPVMERVAGRVADFLKRRDGTRVAGISLIENSLTKFPGIVQLQIVQNAIDDIQLRVVPEPGMSSPVEQQLVAYFSETFPGARIRFTMAKTIEREANGKFRFAICNVAD